MKKKSQRIWFHSQEVSYNFAGFPGMKLCFVQNFQGWNDKPRNSSGFFFKKACPQPPSFFWNNPIYRQETNFWWYFCHYAELDHPFFESSLHHDLFIQTFFQFPYQKFMVLCMTYIFWLGSYSSHDSKCQVYRYLAVCR